MTITLNRILTVLAAITGLGTTISAIAGALPVGNTQQMVLGVGGLLTSLGVSLGFQKGQREWDASANADDDVDDAFREDGLPEIASDENPQEDEGDMGDNS